MLDFFGVTSCIDVKFSRVKIYQETRILPLVGDLPPGRDTPCVLMTVKFQETTVATATRTSSNKRFNEQSNSSAHVL